MKAPKKKTQKKQRGGSVAKLAREYLRAMEEGKRQYKRAEEALNEIVERVKVGTEIPVGRGEKVVLMDLYLETNRVYRAHGISRFELVEP